MLVIGLCRWLVCVKTAGAKSPAGFTVGGYIVTCNVDCSTHHSMSIFLVANHLRPLGGMFLPTSVSHSRYSLPLPRQRSQLMALGWRCSWNLGSVSYCFHRTLILKGSDVMVTFSTSKPQIQILAARSAILQFSHANCVHSLIETSFKIYVVTQLQAGLDVH